MASDEYIELVEDARGALRALLLRTNPGRARYNLDVAYDTLGEWVTHFREQERHAEERGAEHTGWKDELAAMHAARAEWTRLGREERERLVLNALGDEHLIAREIHRHVEAALPQARVWRRDLDPVLKKMVDAGQLNREKVQRGARMLWCYSVRRGLHGEIADLERRFHEGGPR